MQATSIPSRPTSPSTSARGSRTGSWIGWRAELTFVFSTHSSTKTIAKEAITATTTSSACPWASRSRRFGEQVSAAAERAALDHAPEVVLELVAAGALDLERA